MVKRRRREETQEIQALEREMWEARSRLQRAYDAFDLVSDPDLIEAWIFEINAQQARYTYLLKRRKALERALEKEDEVRT